MRIKTLLCLPSLLLLTACNTTTVGVAIAGIGIAGAGLVTYCTASPGNCSTTEAAIGDGLMAEAVADESILLSSTAPTAQKVAEIVANLNSYLLQSKALPQSGPVIGIESAIQLVIPLIEALVTSGGVASANAASASGKPWMTLTREDKSKLREMNAKLAKRGIKTPTVE